MRRIHFHFFLTLLFLLRVSEMRAQQPAAALPHYRAQILSVRPHDADAFTQGLLIHEGKIYESTGLEGRSSLRRVDAVTGAVEKKVDLDPDAFGEGLALVDGKLIQLTWKNKKAYEYDLETFEKVNEFEYEGEGWGLATDGRVLFMTDGSDVITVRDPETFAVIETINVRVGEHPARLLNELEYVDGVLYANVLGQEIILQIDPSTGAVIGLIDASKLLTPEERSRTDVLNGIAYDEAAGSFIITGKLWPKMFEVKFVELPK